MIISVILNTEYMGVEERNKWFLKSVSNAMKEDTLIITHSYFRDHLKEVVEGCADRFYDEFEMERVPVQEIEKLDICYVPDEVFDTVYQRCGNRTKQILYQYNNRIPEIEDRIIRFVDAALKKRGQVKPVYILNCLHVFESIKYISSYYDCPIIPYVFSAIRKVHGYSQTLYMAHIGRDLFNSTACETLFASRESDSLGFRQFQKDEILALLGKKHNMPLLPLLSVYGDYEVGVVGEGFHIIPESYQADQATDDDIYYECNRLFDPDKILTRLHPIQMDQAGIGRKHMKNDPAAFLLNCRRVATVQSQMIIKAAMWNRAAITVSSGLPYSFLLGNNLTDTKPIDDFHLNFILFAYFVPDKCMFDTEYWKWRMTKPSIEEIARRNLGAILSELRIPFDVIDGKGSRTADILRCRGFTEADVQRMLNVDCTDDVPLMFPTSQIRYKTDHGTVNASFFLNHRRGESIITEAELPADCEEAELILQNDIDGYISIDKLFVSAQETKCDIVDRYFGKNEPIMTVSFKSDRKKKATVHWSVKPYDYGRGNT